MTDKDSAAATVDDVLIVSYSRYCRYRAALCRLADQTGSSTVVDALSPRLLAAVGLTADLPPPYTSTVRVLFCRATVVHPALQKHAFRLDELGTELRLLLIVSGILCAFRTGFFFCFTVVLFV